MVTKINAATKVDWGCLHWMQISQISPWTSLVWHMLTSIPVPPSSALIRIAEKL